jgi:hypothetical protein
MKPIQGVIMNYGLGKFIIDCALTFVTGGFWLIWVFVREMRKRNTIVV